MVCKNCGQEFVDLKDYCTGCGTKLKSNKNELSFSKVICIFLGIIVITIIGCYFIINYNTDEEIKPYLDNNILNKTDN